MGLGSEACKKAVRVQRQDGGHPVASHFPLGSQWLLKVHVLLRKVMGKRKHRAGVGLPSGSHRSDHSLVGGGQNHQ